ncbi:MAG: helix-turn-helix domain-containing protein [Chromatiaceae bacterium]|jgi:predicted DNA-binding transcriptional regulator AlpA|nr:helix-turn-helix domain-containing protein [Chromatiaceae bacterium]
MSFARSCSVKEFCARWGIHETTYYRRRADMPRTIKVGGQLRITESDEQEWLRRKQEAASPTGRAA